jgi:hypothetical protein
MALSTQFNQMLTEHVISVNKRYHDIVHEIFKEQCPDIEQIKNNLIKNASDIVNSYDTFSTVTTSIKINLEKLFRSRYSFVKDAEGNKYETIENKLEEFYFIGIEPNSGPSYILQPERVWHMVFDTSSCKSFEAFKVYFYTKDPDVCELRDKLRAEFPDATITPLLYRHCGGNESYLNIEISYKLEEIKNLVELEITQNPTWYKGDLVRW